MGFFIWAAFTIMVWFETPSNCSCSQHNPYTAYKDNCAVVSLRQLRGSTLKR